MLKFKLGCYSWWWKPCQKRLLSVGAILRVEVSVVPPWWLLQRWHCFCCKMYQGFAMFLIMHLFLLTSLSTLNVSELLPFWSNKICIFVCALGLSPLFCSRARVVFEWYAHSDLCIFFHWNVIFECRFPSVCWLCFLWSGFRNNSETVTWPLSFLLFTITATSSAYLTARVNLGLACFRT